MKASVYRDMSIEELRAREKELRTSLFNLRTRVVTKGLDKVSHIRDDRRDRARVLTVIRQKELASKQPS